MERLPLVMVLCLVSALCPMVVQAQAPCSFVLGFAEFASQSGDLVGDCVDEQRTLTLTEPVMVPGYGPMVLRTGETIQPTTHGLLTWNEQLATVEFLSRDGVWRVGDNGLVLTRWEALGLLPPAPSTTAPPAAAPAQPAQSAPDPALMSRCITLAGDLAEELNRDLPPGSPAGGQAFQALLGLCQIAVRQHGARGFSCFETAFRRAIRMNRLMEPGSSTALQAANAEYQLCVSAR